MRMIDIASLRKMFLEFLDETKYNLINENNNDIDDIKFGTDPNDDYHEKIFLEYGFFDEEIEHVPETETEFITPGMFCYDGADIVNNPSYEAYNIEVALEFLPFEKQRESFRKLLERYALDLRGKTIALSYKDKEFKWGDNIDDTGELYNGIINVKMPQLSETVSQSGYDRFQAYIEIDLTVLGNITIDNTISLSIDGELLPLTAIDIERSKSVKTMNIRAKEAKSYAENQSLTFAIEGVIRNNSSTCSKIINGILKSDYLNQSYTLVYNNNTYTMFLQKGTLSIQPNQPTTFTAVFGTLQENL